ncbi:MAG: right-handed parallel beta-helix repeat-containing protein, partial [Candidatus Hodarchaeales archaeon]
AGYAIYSDCVDNVFFRNIASENFYDGMVFGFNCSNNVISENNSTNNGQNGIFLHDNSSSNLLLNNFCYNDTAGIIMFNSSSNTIMENFCEMNRYYGVILYGSLNITIQDNQIAMNKFYGIKISDLSNNNSIRENHIEKNDHHGLYISESNENVIIDNVFIDNNDLDVQAYDDGSNNKFDVDGIGNVWSDWSGSGYYFIEGSAASIDHHPRSLSSLLNQPPVITITIPNGGEVLEGVVNLKWVAFDNDGEVTDLVYSVFYSHSPDDGWIPIPSLQNIYTPTQTANWDTTSIDDGWYWLKITVSDGVDTASDVTDDMFQVLNNATTTTSSTNVTSSTINNNETSTSTPFSFSTPSFELIQLITVSVIYCIVSGRKKGSRK